jgi:uridine kinase
MQNSPSRDDLISEIAEVINNINLPHPVRVAIDGGGNAGKTTLADELSLKLNNLGRSVIRSTIDGFHNPPEIRRKQGKYSPRGYFEDSYNYPLLKKFLLDPLGPNGNLNYKESIYNFKINMETNVEFQRAAQNSVLLFDGIFLFNEQLISYWDYKLYVDASFENTMERAIIRDNELFGGTENVIKLYKKRYIPGQEMYLSMRNPIGVSDIVLNNNDYQNPMVIKISKNKHHNNLFHVRNSLKYNH